MLQVDIQNQRQQAHDISLIMQTEHGRRFMWRLISFCGVYRALEGNTEDMLRQEGRRQIGLYILGILSDENDEEVFNMMREAKNKDMEDNYARRIEQSALDNRDNAANDRSHDYSGHIVDQYV